jgi:integrase
MATLISINGKTKAVIRKQGYPTLCKTFIKKTDALSWSRKTESEMERGLYIDQSKANTVTLDSLLDRYYQYCQTRQLKALKFILAHSRIIKRHIGHLTLANISSHHLAAYRDKRLLTVSPATVKIELGIILRTIKLATSEWGYKLADITKVEYPKINNARTRRLADGEIERVLNAITNKQIKAIVELAVETAMRRSEILNIKENDINWSLNTLRIPNTKTHNARTIPLSNKAVRVLRSLTKNIDGTYFSIKADSASQAFKRACDKTGVHNLRFHDLRHEATTRFFECGLNVMEVATITGHKDLKMLNRYTHLRAENIALKINAN